MDNLRNYAGKSCMQKLHVLLAVETLQVRGNTSTAWNPLPHFGMWGRHPELDMKSRLTYRLSEPARACNLTLKT